MPTYQYRCDECAHEFEEFQSMADKPLEQCPKCKGKVKRLISGGAGFLFKGSGFYATDYRSSQYKKDAARDKGGSPESKKTDSTDKKSSTDKSSSSKSPKKE